MQDFCRPFLWWKDQALISIYCPSTCMLTLRESIPDLAPTNMNLCQKATTFFFLLLPSRPRTSRVAERRATHQRPLESRKIPSKLRGGNLMGRTALKSMGQNPKPTGTFRPGAEGTKKSRNFTQTKRFEMSTVGCSGDLATATLENPRKKRTKSTHCTMQCWKLSD